MPHRFPSQSLGKKTQNVNSHILILSEEKSGGVVLINNKTDVIKQPDHLNLKKKTHKTEFSNEMSNLDIIILSPYLKKTKTEDYLKKYDDFKNLQRTNNKHTKRYSKLRSLHKKVLSQDLLQNYSNKSYAFGNGDFPRSNITPTPDVKKEPYLPSLVAKESQELDRNGNDTKKVIPAHDKKIIKAIQEKTRDFSSVEKTDQISSRGEVSIQPKISQGLPLLNLSRVQPKYGTQDFNNYLHQESSKRVLRTDTDRVKKTELASNLIKATNPNQLTTRTEKSTYDSVERSYRNFLFKGSIGTDSSFETGDKESERNIGKTSTNNGDPSSKGNNKMNLVQKANSITNENKIKVLNEHQKVDQAGRLLVDGNSTNDDLNRQTDINDKPKRSKPRQVNFKSQELAMEQRYDKIMQNNIEEKFNEIFRSMRLKNKSKRVQFSSDVAY